MTRFLPILLVGALAPFTSALAEEHAPAVAHDTVPAAAAEQGHSPADPVKAAGLANSAEIEAKTARLERELAVKAVANGDLDSAEHHYHKALGLPGEPTLKRQILVEFGRFLEDQRNQPIKAIALYEQALALEQNGPETPEICLRLGRIQRRLGAFKIALNRFYSVLHASLRVQDGTAYQAQVLQAQFEIAETHFAAGEYTEAAKFYSRLKLIDLEAEARSQVYFKSAYLSLLAGDFAVALAGAQDHLKQFGSTALAPESQYIAIRALRGLGRHEEALQETLKLLRAGKAHGEQHPKVWAYWQQKTGTELAQDLYGKNDYLNALTIYQALAATENAPEIRWPAVYQIGLCFERLRHLDRAVEAYQFLIAAPAEKADAKKDGTKPGTGVQETMPEPLPGMSLATLREMAQWRLDHLKWLTVTDQQLTVLLSRRASKLEESSFMTPPVPASDQGAAAKPAPAPGRVPAVAQNR